MYIISDTFGICIVVAEEDMARLGIENNGEERCLNCVLKSECKYDTVRIKCGPWKFIDSSMEATTRIDLKTEINILLDIAKAHR